MGLGLAPRPLASLGSRAAAPDRRPPPPRFACEACAGRGWIQQAGQDWAVLCHTCSGHGSFSLGFLARAIGEHHDNLTNVLKMRARRATCVRILGKLIAFDFLHD